MKQYMIYLNEGPGRFWEFDTVSAQLELVYQGETDDRNASTGGHPVELDALFRKFNIQHPADYGRRSLSVGDVAQLDDRFYACSSVGWKELSEAQVRPNWRKDHLRLTTAGQQFGYTIGQGKRSALHSVPGD